MAKRIKSCFAAIVALALVAGAAIGVWYATSKLWAIFAGLQKEVAVAVIAGSVTVTVSVASIVIGKYFERKRLIEQDLREKKTPTYNEFVEFLFSVIYPPKKSEDRTEAEEEEFQKAFREAHVAITKKLMVWGSDEVVAKWSRFRRKMALQKSDSTSAVLELEDLLRAIRRDTGHSSGQLKQGDLLGLFLNDIDEVIPAIAAASEKQVDTKSVKSGAPAKKTSK